MNVPNEMARDMAKGIKIPAENLEDFDKAAITLLSAGNSSIAYLVR